MVRAANEGMKGINCRQASSGRLIGWNLVNADRLGACYIPAFDLLGRLHI